MLCYITYNLVCHVSCYIKFNLIVIDKKVHKAQVNDNKMPKPEDYMA